MNRRNCHLKTEKSFAIEEYKRKIDQKLESFFVIPDEDPMNGYAEAVRYSLLSGGKRIRAILCMEFCRITGGDPEASLDVACALEMLHAYSLIHDDLPCMDDDELRRGKPTSHIVFGEGVATLAGDVLQAEAFGTILRSSLPAAARLRCAEMLSDAVGFDGMCGGQYLDLRGEGKPLSTKQLDEINARKTGALLSASCAMGVAAAGGSSEQEEAAMRFGAAIGMAFQIRDDMLDVLGTETELGKPVGSDSRENKNTYMALLGERNCEETVQKLTDIAKEALRPAFEDVCFLEKLADDLAKRNR